ncbi:hypothetical protein MCUN1_003052 [Malassezia cuniculi]|uniref:Uncharacterized protein n=1 Tax=Malassezia cuniculi TaxID=948313 RepID=A0AAF0ESX8_9BASI|nr:hypothetical protein MCUN1_003052 [Malassezia cuniculi]
MRRRDYNPFSVYTPGQTESVNAKTLTVSSRKSSTHRQTVQNFSFSEGDQNAPPRPATSNWYSEASSYEHSRSRTPGNSPSSSRGNGNGNGNGNGGSSSSGSGSRSRSRSRSGNASSSGSGARGSSSSSDSGSSSSSPTSSAAAAMTSMSTDTPATSALETQTALTSASSSLPTTAVNTASPSKLSTGAIVGIAVGGAVGLIALAVIAWALARWFGKDDDDKDNFGAAPNGYMATQDERPVSMARSAYDYQMPAKDLYNPYSDVQEPIVPGLPPGASYMNELAPGLSQGAGENAAGAGAGAVAGAGAGGAALAQQEYSPNTQTTTTSSGFDTAAAERRERRRQRRKEREERRRISQAAADREAEEIYLATDNAFGARRMRSVETMRLKEETKRSEAQQRHYAKHYASRRSRNTPVRDVYTDSAAGSLPEGSDEMDSSNEKDILEEEDFDYGMYNYNDGDNGDDAAERLHQVHRRNHKQQRPRPPRPEF